MILSYLNENNMIEKMTMVKFMWAGVRSTTKKIVHATHRCYFPFLHWIPSFGIKGLLNSRNNFPFNVTRMSSWLSYRWALERNVNAKTMITMKEGKWTRTEKRKVLSTSVTDVANEKDMFVALSANQRCAVRC